MNILPMLRELRKRYLPTKDTFKVRRELARYPTIHSDQGPLVICQVAQEHFFVHRLVHFLLAYKELRGQDLNIGWILLRRRLQIKTFKNNITYFLFNNRLTDFIWLSLYKSIGGNVVIHYEHDTSKKTQAAAWAKTTQNNLHSKQDLEKITIDGILVGDLIYDTYLRFKPAPTVEIQDKFLFEILKWCWDLYHQLKDYVDHNHPTALVTSYTSYIHHGILVRLMAERNLPVYAVGVSNQLVVQPTKEFPFHKRNFHQYKEYVRNIDIDTAKKEGELLIQGRMEGKIDQATFYMQTSAYRSDKKESAIFGSKNKPRALVMGHDFFDSPHIYGTSLFPDFYDWIEFVFSEAKNSNYDFYYKPHPNGLVENNAINEALRLKFPNIQFIDRTVSNLNILNEGIDIAFSVYGTIAHEFAYKGVPVVCAGVNPHQVYRFNICPASVDELREYIVGLKKPHLDNSEVPEFCYVHNYRYLNGSLTQFPIFFQSQMLLNEHFLLKELNSRVEAMIIGIKSCNRL